MLKRLLDIILLLIFSPVLILIFLFVSFLIYIFDGRPIIFKQKRCGHFCKEFNIYKFRTMRIESKKKKNSDLERITQVGKFLRLTSLDEIPSFYNVLIGNMTLVGPRPLIQEYLHYYTKYQIKRHDVKPGITGLAQINPDPSGLKSWKQSIKLDIYYATKLSLYLDIKILFKTIILILFKQKQYNDFKKF